MAVYPSGLRGRIANPLVVGSNPTAAFPRFLAGVFHAQAWPATVGYPVRRPMRYLLLTCVLIAWGVLDARAAEQAPLLPGGSFIREAGGTLERSEPGQPWTFTIRRGDADQPLILLPSHLLEEIEVEAADRAAQTINFILSGQVLLYRNRNYLILEHVEMETEHAQRSGTQLPAGPQDTDAPLEGDEGEVVEPQDAPLDDDDPWSDEPDDFYMDDQGDSVAAIVAQLQQDVGMLKQSVDRSGELEPAAEGAKEGKLLVSRRCRLTRSNRGAWVVVFDADSRGLREPPMVLLPSATLQSMEYWARATGMNRPILISGQTYTYRGRHFLLPTAWRSPVERPNLK